MFYIRFFLCFCCLFSFVEATLGEHIKFKDSPRAGYLSLPKDAQIDNATYIYVKYALEFFRKEQVSFVLLDLDTPGGEVFAALNIVEELKKMDAEYGIPIVALVDNWALSAGALLAYSCRFIGSTTQGSMGAAAPVTISQEGQMELASEKIVSALRVEFSKTAELYGRNPLVAAAMCDKDLVVVEREGKIISLLDNEQIKPQDLVINAKGKLLTLNAEQMKQFGVIDFMVPEGVQGPLCGQTILFEDPFFLPLRDQNIWITYSNWKIDFFAFLSHPFVSSVLLFMLMIGIYGEMQNPGFGFCAILALGSLFLIFLSTFATQLVSWLEVIFFLLGLVFIIVDVFFLGIGALLGVGIVLTVGGLFSMLLPSLGANPFSEGVMSFAWQEWIYRLSLFLFALLLAFVFCGLLSRLFVRKGFIGKKLILKQPDTKIEVEEKLPDLGTRGKAFSALCPLGKVLIHDRIYEAKTEGEFVRQGTIIEVIFVKEKVLLVREVL